MKIKEYYDIDNLNKLLEIDNINDIKKEKDKDQKNIDAHLCLRKIKKNLKCDYGSYYLEKKYIQKNRTGRWYYDEDPNGLLYLPNSIRGFITQKDTQDLDMCNCHPTILNHIMKENNILCSELDDYVKNREQIMKKYSIKKEDFLCMINNSKYNSNNKYMNGIHKIIYQNLVPILKDHEKDIYKLIPNKENKDGSFISRILQDYEQDIMLKVMEHLNKKEIKYGTFIYDGLHIYDKIDGNFIDDLEKDVKNEYNNTHFKFVVKPFDSSKIEELIKNDIKNYENWKVKWEKKHFYIQESEKIGSLVLRQLKTYNANMIGLTPYSIDPELIEYNNVIFMARWLRDQNKRYCYGFDIYPPPQICPNDLINEWKNYDRENFQEVEIDDNIISLFLDFIKLIAEDDNKCSEYLLNYISHIIQFPGIKPGVMIVISGGQGIGKGTFVNLIKRLIGEYLYTTEDSKTVFGQFTSGIAGKIVINIDESKVLDMFSGNSTLKSLITEPKHKIERKGVDSKMEMSYLRIIITTNDDTPCKIESDDRRTIIFNPEKRNQELVIKVIKFTENHIQMIYQYLKNYKIKYNDMGDWQFNRPKTKMYKDTKTASLDIPSQFILKIVKDKGPIDKFEISNNDLWALFAQYLHLIGKKDYNIDTRTIGKKLLNIQGITETVKKINNKTIRMKEFDKIKVLKWFKNKGYDDHIDYTGINLFDE